MAPSCMRVPPEVGEATSGSRSAVARSTATTSRSAAATPMDPARKANSHATTATGRPPMVPAPVSTDSSRPVRSPRLRELGVVRLGPRLGLADRGVPRRPAARVEDPVEQLAGAGPVRPAHAVLSCSSSQARTSAECSSSRGGGRCCTPSSPSKRSGGPGSVTVPRLLCSTSTSSPCERVCSQS